MKTYEVKRETAHTHQGKPVQEVHYVHHRAHPDDVLLRELQARANMMRREEMDRILGVRWG